MASDSGGDGGLRAEVPQSQNDGRVPSKRPSKRKNGRQDSAVKKTKQFIELEKKYYRAELLLEISKTVAGFETLSDLLENVVEITTRETNAERGSLFLNDTETGELYSRVAQGDLVREIRVLNDSGIAGMVFQEGKGVIIHDAYAHEHFNRAVDQQTGFRTKNILCAPIKTVTGDVIGVVQALNKKKGKFSKDDLAMLEAMATQAAVALQSTRQVERMRRSRMQEMEFLNVVSDVTGEIATSEAGGKAKLLTLVSLAATLSLSLAIINILPIPALDGGRLLFVVIEWVRGGKRISPEREGLVHLAGMIMILALVALISVQDVLRIFRGERFF